MCLPILSSFVHLCALVQVHAIPRKGVCGAGVEVGLLVEALHNQLGLPPAAADHLLLLLGGNPGLAIDQDTFVTSALSWWAGWEEGLVGEFALFMWIHM